MIPYSIKSSADVQVEILSDDKLKSRRKKASGATLRIACLSQPCLTVGDNQSSRPTASSASIRERLSAIPITWPSSRPCSLCMYVKYTFVCIPHRDIYHTLSGMVRSINTIFQDNTEQYVMLCCRCQKVKFSRPYSPEGNGMTVDPLDVHTAIIVLEH